MAESSSLEKFQLSRRPSRIPKPERSILKSKGGLNTIWYKGKDATPQPISPDHYIYSKERQLRNMSFDGTSGSSSEKLSSGAVRFAYYQTMLTDTSKSSSTFMSTNVHSSENLLEVFQGVSSARTSSSSAGSILSAGGRVEAVKIKEEPPSPTHISLKLRETDTFTLVEFSSTTAWKGTEEGDLVEEDNELYDYLTVGKGRNRRVTPGEAQTSQINLKSRATLCGVGKRKNDYALVNDALMFDTYTSLDRARISSEFEVLSTTSEESHTHSIGDMASEESYKMAIDEKQTIRIIKNPRFMDAVCIMERLLANNYFNEQQKRFRGLSDPEPFRENIEYKYRLNFLWTFANHDTEGRCVTALEWNKRNEDLLAVGYGRFFLEEDTSGIVMIWNIKNPVQPERTYKFKPSVNTLNFSQKDPNLLAVGFSDGGVMLLNIVSHEKQVVAQNEPLFDQTRHISCVPGTEQNADKELIFATSNDGRVTAYNAMKDTSKLVGQELMRVAKAYGLLKGYKPLKYCTNLRLPAYSYSSALLVAHHPEIPTIYFVGTNQGIVHKCSTNYLHEHLDLFCAHDGPINAMKFNPFCNNVFATCGDDWFVRLWSEGIAEPLHELYVTMRSVQDMDWSPTHPSILATIYANRILLWDFQRKFYEPQSVTESRTSSRNSVVRFVSGGRCLVVGDVSGNVHVYSLEDMPFPPFFPAKQLYYVLKENMVTDPALWKKLSKLFKGRDKEEENDYKDRHSSFKSDTALSAIKNEI